MKTLTVIGPVYREEAVIEAFYTELKAELAKLSNWESKILFVVDKSNDRTLEILRKIAQRDPSVGVIGLSTRFGHQMSLLAGLDHAQGNAIIMMDTDLQHPPAVIPELLAQFEQGKDIVYTIRETSGDVSLLRAVLGSIFYRFVNAISDVPIIENASDFRLISRRVADVIRTGVGERNLFLRGIFAWVGFEQGCVRFAAHERRGGKSKYSLTRLLQFATSGIISFSKKPLRAASIVGVLFALFGFCVAAGTIVQYFIYGSLPSGFATLVVLLSLFGGVQLIFLGIIGEYIGAIFDEVKARPRYIVEESINVLSQRVKKL